LQTNKAALVRQAPPATNRPTFKSLKRNIALFFNNLTTAAILLGSRALPVFRKLRLQQRGKPWQASGQRLSPA
jgi:hypothetical protein